MYIQNKSILFLGPLQYFFVQTLKNLVFVLLRSTEKACKKGMIEGSGNYARHRYKKEKYSRVPSNIGEKEFQLAALCADVPKRDEQNHHGQDN